MYSLVNSNNNNSLNNQFVRPSIQQQQTAFLQRNVMQDHHHHHQLHESPPLLAPANVHQQLFNDHKLRSANQLSPDQIGRSQEQHRRLQYQVHQQLHKIYGNKLQELEQHDQIPPNRQQQGQTNTNKNSLVADKRAEMIKARQMCLVNGINPHQTYHQEQTYDSLDPQAPLCNDAPKQQIQEDFYDVQAHRRPSICAIPEECYHDDDDKEELSIPDEPGLSINMTKRKEIADRKKQLESLHYATATAAALLNVTANAAAAFAATEKQFQSNQRQPTIKTESRRTVSQQRPNGTIYSETYQDIGVKQQRSQSEPYRAFLSRYAKQPLQHQQSSHRPPIYATTSDRVDFNRANQRPKLAGSLQAPQTLITNNRNLPHAIYNLQASDNIYRHYAVHQPNSLDSRLVPARARLPAPNQNVMQQLDMVKRHNRMLHQQQYQPRFVQQGPSVQSMPPAIALPADGVPALVILQGSKSAGLKVDLIGRLPVNQTATQQQQQKQRLLANLDSRYAVARANQVPFYGVVEPGRDNKQQLCGVPRPFVPAITSAPSDTSAHSNVPLVLDRRLKTPSFIERISRIDLTLFWWSLLIVCMIFIATVVTITRHIL